MICAIQGICMINEQITGVNVFNLVGGVGIPVETIDKRRAVTFVGVMGPVGQRRFRRRF